jgi:hypothetical protein
MCEMAQKLVNILLFSFQDLKQSTKDIIAILKDNLNTTSNPLSIPNPHVIRVPCDALPSSLMDSNVNPN